MKKMTTMGAACLLAASALAAEYGPLVNKEDQFRFIWGSSDRISEDLVRSGFNTVIDYSVGYWDLWNDAPKSDIRRRAAIRKDHLDNYLRLGLGSVIQLRYSHAKSNFFERCPRIRKDGSRGKQLDAANPLFVETSRHAIREEARTLEGHPAVVGAQTASEIRDSSEPSYTPAMRAAYEAYSGRDVPEEAAGRNPPSWKTLKDFPKDRVVPDDYPLLDFYRWTWKKGDGWNDFQTMAAEEFNKAFGRDVLTMYDPSIRTPPFWGNGGKVSHLNHWTYTYPEPFNISYNVSQQHSMARGNGQKVWAMIQAITYRSRLAPIGEHPANEPEWTKEFPNAMYPSCPPDVVQEAMWTVFSRQVDGIGFHGWNALYDGKIEDREHDGRGYQCTNPHTIDTIEKVFHEVGEPLGPLFRAIPEREPVVAVVESYASVLLGGRVTWDCQGSFFDCGVLATTANLMPYALNEEQIATWGVPASVKVLLMPDVDVLTKTACDKIKAFVARGGRILADDRLVPALASEATLPTVAAAFDEVQSDHDEGVASKKRDAAMRAKAMARAADKLRTLVKIALYADSDRRDILASARSCKGADYLFAINDKRAFGDYMGAWGRVLDKGLPNAGEVSVARSAGAVYDLVRHAAVPFEVRGGRTFVKVDYATNDGRVFLVAEKPLGDLSVKVEGTVVTVTSPDVDVLVPVKVTGVGAKPWYAVVKNGTWSRDFGAAAKNAKVSVISLATGK